MNRKLVITSVGSGALGALISWAVTADILEHKARLNRAAFRKVIEKQQKLIWEMHDNGKSMEEVLNGSIVDEDQLELLGPGGDVRDLTPDEQPKAYGGTVEIVTDIDQTAEGQEIQAALEDDEVDEEEFERTRTNLQKQIDMYTASPEDRDEFVEILKRVPAEPREAPFVIDKGLYAWDEDEGNEYEKTTFTFYSRERILVDEDEEGIDHRDVDEYVGWKNLNRFGDGSGDPDVVFIRNRRLKTDFEVVRSDEKPPAHVKYGMGKEEYKIGKAAGLIKFREE